jgi:hypothetical protein
VAAGTASTAASSTSTTATRGDSTEASAWAGTYPSAYGVHQFASSSSCSAPLRSAAICAACCGRSIDGRYLTEKKSATVPSIAPAIAAWGARSVTSTPSGPASTG